jgi:hypothetical protein
VIDRRSATGMSLTLVARKHSVSRATVCRLKEFNGKFRCRSGGFWRRPRGASSGAGGTHEGRQSGQAVHMVFTNGASDRLRGEFEHDSKTRRSSTGSNAVKLARRA